MTPSDDWSAYPSVMPSTVNASNRASALTNTVFLNKSPPSLESKKNLSLFGESDSDDDNIFSSASSTKKSTKSQVTKAESSSAPSTSNTPASANQHSSIAVKKFSAMNQQMMICLVGTVVLKRKCRLINQKRKHRIQHRKLKH